MKKSKKAFTLVELIVVLAILAVLMAIAVPLAFGSIEDARKAADEATMETINSAIRTHSALIMLEPTLANNLIIKAIENAGINIDKNFQAKGLMGGGKESIKYLFYPATPNRCAYFKKDPNGVEANKNLYKSIREYLDVLCVTGYDEPANAKLSNATCVYVKGVPCDYDIDKWK